MLGWGLNIVVGLAGLLDLGYVAFYAVGAYSYALLAKTFGLSFWILLPLAGVLASFWGILLGFPVLRLRGDYLAIVTLAFGEIIRLILINWVRADQRLCRHHQHSAADFFRHSRSTPTTTALPRSSACEFSPLYRVIFLYYLILALALLDLLRHRAAAPPADRPRLGGACARTRSPAARSASTPPTPSSPRSPWARCSPASPARSSPRARPSSRRNPSPSSSRRPSSPSWCSAAWAARSASPSPPSS